MTRTFRRWSVDAAAIEASLRDRHFALSWQDRIDAEHRSKRLPSVQHRVLCVLQSMMLRYGETSGHVYPSQATLAEEAWCSIGTVKNACISAELLGLLRVIERSQESPAKGGHHQTSNEYVFLLPDDAIPCAQDIREWKTNRWAHQNQRRWESKLRLADSKFFDAELGRRAYLALPGLPVDKLCSETKPTEYNTFLIEQARTEYRKDRTSFCGTVLRELAQQSAAHAASEKTAKKDADRKGSDADEQRIADANRNAQLAWLAQLDLKNDARSIRNDRVSLTTQNNMLV